MKSSYNAYNNSKLCPNYVHYVKKISIQDTFTAKCVLRKPKEFTYLHCIYSLRQCIALARRKLAVTGFVCRKRLVRCVDDPG